MFSGSSKNMHSATRLMLATRLFGLMYFIWSQQYVFIVAGILLGWILLQFSHHVALHRYFSHHSFKTSNIWHAVLCFSTVLVGVTPIYYALPHLAHHAFTDTEKDPHSPTSGFWNVFLIHKWNVEHLEIRLIRNYKDFWIQFTAKWYVLILLVFCTILALINPNLLLSYGIAIWFTKFAAVTVNYTGHLKNFPGNYRNFETEDQSCNNLFTGVVLGEWHNNHHHNPRDWNQKVKWWELDIPAIIIRAIKT